MHGLRRGSGCCRGCRDRCGSVCGEQVATEHHLGPNSRTALTMAWSSDLLPLDRAPAETDCLGVGLTMGVALCCTTGAESGTLSPRSSEIRFHLLRTESSERPARCGAMARHRVPCWAIRLWMAASSSAD